MWRSFTKEGKALNILSGCEERDEHVYTPTTKAGGGEEVRPWKRYRQNHAVQRKQRFSGMEGQGGPHGRGWIEGTLFYLSEVRSSQKTNFSPSTCTFWGSNLNPQVWLQAPLPEEPSHQPLGSILTDRWVVFCWWRTGGGEGAVATVGVHEWAREPSQRRVCRET